MSFSVVMFLTCFVGIGMILIDINEYVVNNKENRKKIAAEIVGKYLLPLIMDTFEKVMEIILIEPIGSDKILGRTDSNLLTREEQFALPPAKKKKIETVPLKININLFKHLLEGKCQPCGCKFSNDIVFCPACQTPHHADCWNEFGCSTYACKFARKSKEG